MSTINLTDSDEDLPGPSGLSYRYAPSNLNLLSPTATTVSTAQSTAAASSKRPAATVVTATKETKKKKKTEKRYCLIWVCTHGKGQRSSWRQKDLKIVGVYPNKASAEEGKRQVMSKYDCCGHGDILVGGCWDDEIDLVIREAPMFFDS